MNHYININDEISNTRNYFHENAKINNINYSSNNQTKHIKYCNNKNNNSTLITPYKINSLNSHKNLSQMINGIKDGIEEISIQMKNTDDKIENYIKKNYIKNRPINTKLCYHNRIHFPRPKSQGKKLLSVNNSFISSTNQPRDNNNKSTNISNITYQCEYTNTSGSKLINRRNNNNNSDSAKNILYLTDQNMNNNINDYNNLFSKSSYNFNNRNPLHLSHSKLKSDKEVINNNINSSFINNISNISTNNNINKNNNCKCLYRAPSNKKHKEINQLNEVLQKQLIEVRLQLYDANKKIEDYSEVIKNLKIDNKNLFDEKKYYENKFKELSEESNYDKNYKLNEIESQKKIIGQMDMEISQLNNIINEKDTLIQNLKAQVNLMFNLNNLDNNNNDNNDNINMDKKITKKMSYNNINSHINGINLNNNSKYNKNLFKKLDPINVKTEINNLKEEFEKLININNKNNNKFYNRKSESSKISKNIGKIKNENNTTSLLELKKIKNEYLSLKREYNLLKNEDNNLRKEYEKDNNKIKSLVKENKEINDLYNKLKIEYEKISKKNINIKYDEKDLGKLKQENDSLQAKINEQKKTIEQLNKTNNDINKKSETENQQNKLSIIKLENQITSLKEEKNNLAEINQQLKNSNEELIKEKDKNITQIKELKKINEEQKKSKNILQKNLETKNNEFVRIEKQLNENNKNIEGNKILEQKIKKYEETKINLEKKISDYENRIKELEQKIKVSDANKESLSNEKINKVNMGKKYLDENNDELQKEILSLKEQIKELENENHNYFLEATKLKDAEKKISEINKENELNFTAMQNLKKENQELLEIISNYKKNKNNNLENSEDFEGDEYEENEENEMNQGSFNLGIINKPKNKKNIILELKNQLKEKDNIISEKDKEINEFKQIKGFLIKDNTDKQETIEKLKDNSVSSKQEQSYILIIETLKNEIKEHQHTISELTKKNTELNDLFKSNNIPNSNNYFSKKKNKFEKASIAIRDEVDNNNNNHSDNRIDNNRLSRISGITSTSIGLSDQERIDKYKKKLKEYKKEIESHKNQINTLKEEIRELNHKLKNPIIQNLEEFINLFHIAFSEYKPNKKEQKEAFEKIIQNFGLNNI